jgi:endonuclease/exonuclease/phosphatase family metal-dependent hydrolase
VRATDGRGRDGSTLRALTLNLWARGGDWRARRKVLVDGLTELRPDVVAFQEAVKNDEYDQVADLLGSEFSVVHQTVGLVGDGESRAAIASRWPIGDVSELDLHLTARTADYACVTLAAEILVSEPLGTTLFVNHAPSWRFDAELERELQAVAAATFIDDLVRARRLHVVLAGDLNARPEASSVRFWSGLQALGGTSVCYRDAWAARHPDEPGYTFSPRNPLVPEEKPPNPVVPERARPPDVSRRIDYLFVRCDEHGPTLDVASCALAFDEARSGTWASDHFGVVADFRLPGSTL